MIAGFGLIAFRDSYGIRPLCIGSRVQNGKMSYMVASESVALQSSFGCKPEDIRDVEPGQAVIIEKNKSPRYEQIEVPKGYAPVSREPAPV